MAGFAQAIRPDRIADQSSRKRKSVQTLAELFTGLEIGNLFLADRDRITRTRVATDTCITLFDRKGTKTAKLDPVSAGKRVGDFVKDRCNNPFDVSLIEMRIQLSKPGNQFRFRHFQAPSCSC
jgi:hypothetical protein